ncbi:MAG TPA: GerMN domain-containing protein [Terriglobia bacterium]|nr:GerMN domain-containing protein [Terriglobia bacterium]
MSRRVRILLFVVLGIVAAAILYLRVLARYVFVETPARTEQQARTTLSQAALQSQAGGTRTITLYFPSYDQGALVGETRDVNWPVDDADRIREVLLALIEGSGQGHGPAMPPSTGIRAVFLLPDGTAYVDLTKEVLSGLAPGIGSETLAVYSIVDSLAANVPAVKLVRITVEGQVVETLDGHADLTVGFVPDSSRIAK